jgi:hypothetical protein
MLRLRSAPSLRGADVADAAVVKDGVACLVAGMFLALMACGDAGVRDPSSTAGVDERPVPSSQGSGEGPDAGDANTGSVGAQITLPAGQAIEVVLWTLTASTSAVVQTGSVDVSRSLRAAFSVGNIPAGSGYRVALSATTIDGSVICAGSATFDVFARQTTQVSALMACNVATSGAQVTRVDGVAFDCAAINNVTISPDEVTVGSFASASASATGPAPGAITVAWSAFGGTFDNPSSPTPRFTCTQPGTATLTVTAADGPVPSGSSCNAALGSRTVTVKCDAPVVATAVPALPPWAVALLSVAVFGAGSFWARRRSRIATNSHVFERPHGAVVRLPS